MMGTIYLLITFFVFFTKSTYKAMNFELYWPKKYYEAKTSQEKLGGNDLC